MDRHERTGSSLPIRAGGAALLCLAAYATHLLFIPGSPLPPGQATALDYLLAAIAFICASTGGALVVLGAHVLDEVPLSPRWAGTYREQARRE